MSTESATTTTTHVAKGSSRAAEKAIAAVAAASETLPTVVETAEVAMEIPAKVVLNQKLIVTVSIFGGAAAGAGILWGVQKLRARLQAKKIEKQVEEVIAPSPGA